MFYFNCWGVSVIQISSLHVDSLGFIAFVRAHFVFSSCCEWLAKLITRTGFSNKVSKLHSHMSTATRLWRSPASQLLITQSDLFPFSHHTIFPNALNMAQQLWTPAELQKCAFNCKQKKKMNRLLLFLRSLLNVRQLTSIWNEFEGNYKMF